MDERARGSRKKEKDGGGVCCCRDWGGALVIEKGVGWARACLGIGGEMSISWNFPARENLLFSMIIFYVFGQKHCYTIGIPWDALR